ncbi:ImmA/IrrE family metallo-endopeptidase [Streptomyces sp. Tue 6430]|nr:ImmA/IrrE family metallo-endopeptidase [Streptomyces sp. Tue 6430]
MKELEKTELSKPSAAYSRRYFKQLRRECVARLTDLPIDRKDRSIRTLKDHLSRKRGRPIYLVPMALPHDVLNGMWVATPVADFVIYAAHATRAHQEHIIAHELGHIMCDHQAVSDVGDGILGQLFPDISPTVVRRVLTRTRYSHRNEQEAEMIASLYCARLDPRRAEPLPLCSRNDVIDRLRTAIAVQYVPENSPTGM